MSHTISDVEHILAIPRSAFDSAGSFQGFNAATEKHLTAFFAPGIARFLPRPNAEQDPTHKQLIPYCILTHDGDILCYQRGGSSGEKRLVSKLSIGIGGHINPVDAKGQAFDESAYRTAVHREINEEVCIPGIPTSEIRGLINDDSNAVGSVHLGVVEVFNLESKDVHPNEAAIHNPRFLSIKELKAERENLETWSRIVIDHIEEILPG